MSQPQSVGQVLLLESRRHLGEESLPRIEQCLAAMTDEAIWARPNSGTVSVGNLVIHLTGNVRQWILGGLGGVTSSRDRDREFAEPGPLPRERIRGDLRAVVEEACRVLEELDPESLLEKRTLQGFTVTGVSILVHVVEHFSYHTGQITYRLKSTQGVDTDYYNESETDLNAE